MIWSDQRFQLCVFSSGGGVGSGFFKSTRCSKALSSISLWNRNLFAFSFTLSHSLSLTLSLSLSKSSLLPLPFMATSSLRPSLIAGKIRQLFLFANTTRPRSNDFGYCLFCNTKIKQDTTCAMPWLLTTVATQHCYHLAFSDFWDFGGLLRGIFSILISSNANVCFRQNIKAYLIIKHWLFQLIHSQRFYCLSTKRIMYNC